MNINTTIKTLLFAALLPLGVVAQSHYPGQHKGQIKIDDTKKAAVLGFDLQDVKLLDSPFRDNMMRESKWILSIKTESLLHSFRNNAGVFSGKEGGYFVTPKLGGWESLDSDVRGHTTGHVLSGLALLYASTGDERYKVKADSLVNGLADVQKALNQNGYLSAFPQNLIDRAVERQSVWAPWYTLHKLYSGLTDQYLYCNNAKALEIANGMVNWAYDKMKALTTQQRENMLKNEFGGMNDSFYTLYEITGNEKAKYLAEFFYHAEVLKPLAEKQDILKGKHANTYIPKLIGLVRDYEIGGQAEHLETSDFFWQTVVNHHSFATGSNSDKEKFFGPDNIAGHLSGYTAESCNVYNMLKLTRHLFSMNPKAAYADYYERALYNHILGQQNPEDGMVAYFLPMMPGAHKVYSTPNDSFWCCVGTGFENQAKYNEFIYAHSQNSLYINLFIPSVLSWKENGFEFKQETTFPKESNTKFTVTASAGKEMTIHFRYPAWATAGATLRVNGKKQKFANTPGSYIAVKRVWKKGDVAELDLPMPFKVTPTPDNKNIVAVTYGPVVLAGLAGTEGMNAPAPYSDPKKYNDYYTYDYNVPAGFSNKLAVDAKALFKALKREPGTLNFSIDNTNWKLMPISSVHSQRYTMYWELTK
ncbi:glycoside hydrolase family 127 protein [Flavobacterium sp. Sd200]|uniref:glycoside hydrolase family 127 protein n=1 Tax=Flavobacterium sp. Sd200 TaxID=2692211 RepID=UPI00137049C7|nr:glycoside hydrolase family 127 protein [Flavobacterium sp. Sd200]MXN90761.1 glycoside hydrolase family 127 protein [Flavobacterium sp. Sd200]